ncbi:MAG: hypothetical protein IGS48_13720 [Oscillatoriales cyanobacterium C42_A2020_001]|nr:hypothetical protein [Leptolyngbyaceae cyanobacterium C42_A2020_001]
MRFTRRRQVIASLLIGSTSALIWAIAAVATTTHLSRTRLGRSAATFQFFNLSQRELWLQVNSFGNATRATPLNLWATYYHIHHAQTASSGEPLLDKHGQRLGPMLSHEDWCRAAIQGTVRVSHARGETVYTFSGRGDSPQTNCAAYFTSLAPDVLNKVNRARFTVSPTLYGEGTRKYKLVPYRTIAVDRSQIPLGSVLYIPAARGQLITLPSGDRVYHDGFFYAADVGSGIQGNHIDVFLGISSQNPFLFITSRSSGTFQAYLIQDPDISGALYALHRSR